MLRVRTVTILLGLALLAVGCRSKEAPPPTPKAVTVDEATELAKSLEASMAECSSQQIDAAIDVEHMFRLAAAGLSLTSGERRGIMQGARQGIGFGQRICTDVGIGTTYRFMRARKQGEEVSILFRAQGENGVNYMEMFVGKGPSGQAQVYDIYVYMSGERMSETMADILKAFTGSSDMQQAKSFSDEIENVNSFLASGHGERAMQSLERIPARVRARRAVRLLEIQVAALLGDEEYAKAIASYEAAYPGDPSLDLVSIDGFFLRKQYDEAIASLDRLDDRIGGDPYLDTMAASMLLEKPDLDAAWKRAMAAIEAGSDVEDSYWVALTVAIQREEFGEATKIMTMLGDRFDIVFDPLAMAEEPLYAGLLQSEEWKTWSAAALAETEGEAAAEGAEEL